MEGGRGSRIHPCFYSNFHTRSSLVSRISLFPVPPLILPPLIRPPHHAGPGGGTGNSASGGGGGVRRLISDVPPHIQQLLEQQDRQSFERGSPSRRLVYRKIVGAPSSEGFATGYAVPGVFGSWYHASLESRPPPPHLGSVSWHTSSSLLTCQQGPLSSHTPPPSCPTHLSLSSHTYLLPLSSHHTPPPSHPTHFPPLIPHTSPLLSHTPLPLIPHTPPPPLLPHTPSPSHLSYPGTGGLSVFSPHSSKVEVVELPHSLLVEGKEGRVEKGEGGYSQQG